MAQQYGTVKVDFITFTSGTTGNETDITIPVSGLADIAESGINISGDISARNITATGDLSVSGETLTSGLIVQNGATISGDLGVSGEVTASSVTVTGTLNASGAVNVSGLLTTSGLSVSGDAGVNALTVTGLAAVGTLTTTGSATVNGPATLNSGLTVGGATSTFNDTVTIASGLTVTNGGIVVSNAGGLNVDGDVIFQDNLNVSGTASFDNINASGTTTLNELTVTGAMTFATGLFASGTQTAPSISFVGDTDTGFYNAAANEIRITTSGNDRLTVDDTGNVGIGTTSPDAPLSFGKNVYGEPGSEDFYRIKFSNFGGTNNDVGIGQSAGKNLDFNGQEGFRFLLGTSGEAARITSDGNVGIGVTDPEARLTIRPGAAAGSTIGGRSISYGANLESTSGRSGFLVRVNNAFTSNGDNSGFQWLFPFDSGGDLDYKVYRSATGSTLVDKFWVNQGGGGYFADRVGIGTTNPGSSLEISNSNPTFAITDTDTANTTFRVRNANGTVYLDSKYNNGNGVIAFTRNGESAESARIDSDGNVGIGTSSPTRRLEIKTGSGIAGFKQSSSALATTLEFLRNGGNTITNNAIEVNTSTGNVYELNYGGGAYFAGKVGIGTTDPLSFLDVKSPLLNTAETVASFGNGTIPGGLEITTNGNLDWGFNAKNSRNLTFSTNQNERARIDGDGDVGIGTTNPADLVHLSSADSTLRIDTKRNGTTYGNSAILLGSPRSTSADNTTISGRGLLACLGNSTSTLSTVWLQAQSASLDPTATDADLKANQCGIRLSSDGSFQHWADGSQRFNIDSSGNVGIGTTAPSQKLAVSGGNILLDSNNQLRFGTSDAAFIEASGSEGSGGTRYMRFGVNSEAVRIDSSGRLLVGTSSSVTSSVSQQSLLQVYSTSSSSSSVQIGNYTNGANPAGLHFDKSRGSLGTNTVLQSGDNIGDIKFNGADGTNLVRAASISCAVDGTPGANDMPGRLVFSTTADGASSPTERMRINSGGNTSVFSSLANSIVSRSSSSAGTVSNLFVGLHSATSITTGTQSFIVRTNGNVENTNNSYGAISDSKLKENIVDANSQWDDLKALQIRNYNFKEGQTHTQIGLVAQEVELVSPGLVSESPDRDEDGNDLGTVTKSVNYSVLYMKAVKALQEAMERIETLEQRLTDAGIA